MERHLSRERVKVQVECVQKMWDWEIKPFPPNTHSNISGSIENQILQDQTYFSSLVIQRMTGKLEHKKLFTNDKTSHDHVRKICRKPRNWKNIMFFDPRRNRTSISINMNTHDKHNNVKKGWPYIFQRQFRSISQKWVRNELTGHRIDFC